MFNANDLDSDMRQALLDDDLDREYCEHVSSPLLDPDTRKLKAQRELNVFRTKLKYNNGAPIVVRTRTR